MSINVQVSPQYQGVIEQAGAPQNSPVMTGKFEKYDTLSDRPTAAAFGVGQCQIGGTVYVSDGVGWTAKQSGRLGIVASRCTVPTTYSSANKQACSRSKHWAYDTISQLQIVYWNGYMDSSQQPNVEVSNPGTTTYWAQVEDNLGNILGVCKWGGSSSVTAAGGALVTSDQLTLSRPIKKGEAFFVTQFLDCSTGLTFVNVRGSLNETTGVSVTGESMTYGASGIQNRVTAGLSGAFASTTAYLTCRPAAIIAYTTSRSVALIGDSRNGGTFHNATDGYGSCGEITPSIGRDVPVLQLHLVGANAQYENGHLVARKTLAQYCTDVIINMGINDFSATRTATQCLTDVQAIVASINPQKAYICTVAPKTDAGNTTTDATANPARVAFNAMVRAIPAGFSGYFEIADLVESARDSGLWKTGYTGDGLHENQTGANAIQASLALKMPIG